MPDAWDGKHLVLLSGPMGSGHVRAAAALEACARERYPGLRVTHVNVFDLMTFAQKKLFTSFYLGMLKHFPLGWSYLYRKLDSPAKRRSLVAWFFEFFRYHRLKNRLLRKLQELRPDYIICTHFLPAELLDRFKREKKITVPTAVVVTDFSLHWVYVRRHLDYFFVTSHEIAFRLTKRGIAPEKIYITGCPVFPVFAKTYSKSDLVGLRYEFGLPPRMLLVMVTMGGDSVGRLAEISQIVLKNFQDIGVIALAGRKKEAYESLLEVKKKYPDRMFPIPFTPRVADYLAISAVVITKPGGISVSECLAMKKPMVIMDPIPGQEERNTDYLLERGLVSKATDEVSLIYKDVLLNSEVIDMETRQLNYYSRPLAGFDILAAVLDGKSDCRYLAGSWGDIRTMWNI